jgi:AcrR family transcriptional regulator
MGVIDIASIIKQESKHEFEKFGLKKTNMTTIAKRCNKSKATLYYYFESKEQIYYTLVKQEFHKIKELLREQIVQESDAAAGIESYLKMRLLLFSNFKLYHQTIQADFKKPFIFLDNLRLDFKNFDKETLQVLLEKGKINGNFFLEDTSKTSVMIQLIIESLETSFYVQQKHLEFEDSLNELLGVILTGLKITD